MINRRFLFGDDFAVTALLVVFFDLEELFFVVIVAAIIN